MEELDLDYEIKKYTRKPVFPSEELQKIYPTGLVPILQIFKPGHDYPLVLAESGYIVLYLIRHYDPSHKLRGHDPQEEELVNYYLHFAEASLQSHLVAMLVVDRAVHSTPWPLLYVANTIADKMNEMYFHTRLHISLRLLDDRLAAKNGGYLVGDRLSAADIMLDYPINECLFENGPRCNELGLIRLYPNLCKWHQLTSKMLLRLRAREKATI